VFDLETGKQGHVVAITFDTVDHVGHDMAHELAGLFVDFVGIDQDFADIRLEVIANGADNEGRFMINQECARSGAACAFDGVPELKQVIQIPLQFLRAPSNTCGTGDNRHASRYFQLVHRFTQFLTFFTFDAAGNTASARIVRHQNQITASQ